MTKCKHKWELGQMKHGIATHPNRQIVGALLVCLKCNKYKEVELEEER